MNKIYKVLIFIYKILGNSNKVIEYRIKYLKCMGVAIGDNLRCFSEIVSAEPYLLEIGNNVTISTGVNFVTHDNSIIKIFEDGTDSVGRIKIGDNAFIGINSIILPGVELGINIIVGAGSVVTKSFKQGNVVIGGNPAKIICTVEDYKNKINGKYFNFSGISLDEKKKMILKGEKMFLCK